MPKNMETLSENGAPIQRFSVTDTLLNHCNPCKATNLCVCVCVCFGVFGQVMDVVGNLDLT